MNKKQKPQRIVSIKDQGSITELIYDHENTKTSFLSWDGNQTKLTNSYTSSNGKSFIPYSPESQILNQHIVNFPSTADDYGSPKELFAEIRSYIHKYVDVSERFEKISAYYVLLSWVYDAFNEIPYLRLRGSFGAGKTRFLQIVGSLCYKSFLSSGASTVAPIFHLLNSIGGTLVLDEADMRFSDETADLVKILNNGTVKSLPVLRCQKTKNHEFEPRAFRVFGPKIVATRGYYNDMAFESRFISEDMEQRKIRSNIPHVLPKSYKQEALNLRNKLLMYRFKNLHSIQSNIPEADKNIAGRLNQMFLPLLAVIDSEQDRQELRELAKQYDRDLKMEIGNTSPAQVIDVISEIVKSKGSDRIHIKEITSVFINRFGVDYERRITPKWIGSILRKQLRFSTHKSHGNYVIDVNQDRLKRLCEIYNVQES